MLYFNKLFIFSILFISINTNPDYWYLYSRSFRHTYIHFSEKEMPGPRLCTVCRKPVVPEVNNMLVEFLCGHHEHHSCYSMRRSSNMCSDCGVFSPFVILRWVFHFIFFIRFWFDFYIDHPMIEVVDDPFRFSLLLFPF